LSFSAALSAIPDEEVPTPRRQKRIVLVDDSPLYAESWRAVLTSRYGDRVAFEAYDDPMKAVPTLGADIDLLLLDLEMPVLDGRKMAAIAEERGVSCKRIVIISAHHADELHALFPPRSCLAVINKTDPSQQQAFLMILDSVMKR
jgi:CheY-like chemotaxis protein